MTAWLGLRGLVHPLFGTVETSLDLHHNKFNLLWRCGRWADAAALRQRLRSLEGFAGLLPAATSTCASIGLEQAEVG